jgi:hypothetical protein
MTGITRLKSLLYKIIAMKKNARVMVLIAITVFSGMEMYAQCTPDATCVDIGDPGQFCPLDLPTGVLNVLYDEVVTVIPPGSFSIQGLELTILYIQIDSVKNMPPGIDYFPNADRLYPDTAYCIQLTGTPTQAGVDTLAIYISATVNFGGNPITAGVVDDTSLVITILEAAGIDPNQGTAFRVYQNVPNPFTEVTRLDYYSPFDDFIELDVYNILGILMHEESVSVVPGEHYFEFDGSGLQPGTYFYRVSNSKTYVTGKFIKSR